MYPADLQDNKVASQITCFIFHIRTSCFHRRIQYLPCSSSLCFQGGSRVVRQAITHDWHTIGWASPLMAHVHPMPTKKWHEINRCQGHWIKRVAMYATATDAKLPGNARSSTFRTHTRNGSKPFKRNKLKSLFKPCEYQKHKNSQIPKLKLSDESSPLLLNTQNGRFTSKQPAYQPYP